MKLEQKKMYIVLNDITCKFKIKKLLKKKNTDDYIYFCLQWIFFNMKDAQAT